MSKKAAKTNVVRLLEKAGMTHETLSYEVDENDLSATHLAATIGEDIRRVFKTLVLWGERSKHFVCVVPGACEVDLKKAARVSGNKKVELIAMKDLLPVTGYIRGGCSPIGMKKRFPTFIHQSCNEYEAIFVSAGMRGLQVKLSPADLIKITGAVVSDLIKD